MRASLLLFLHPCLAFEVDERLKMLEGVRFSPEQKHRELLESVIEFGLNQSQYLQEIQERDLWTKGAVCTLEYFHCQRYDRDDLIIILIMSKFCLCGQTPTIVNKFSSAS